jgi:type IV pilus assembly protein PilW
MVAMVIGLVISIAAIAALVVARTGFTTVDSTAQLRENARFTSDLMQRIIVQAGFENWSDGTLTRNIATQWGHEDPEPDITGFNNAVFPASPGLPPLLANNSRDSACGGVTDSSCVNGSDVLIVRYQGMDRPGAVGTADGSIVNCAGIAEPAVAISTADRAWSVFHVARSPQSGEPVLMCSYRTAGGAWDTQPMIQGVESFQVLYGTDSVAINADSTTPAAKAAVGDPDSVPERYLRADQIIVPGNEVATRANWRRVRSVRIGLVLRGPVGSKPNGSSVTTTLYPFGTADVQLTNLSSSDDKGTVLTIPEDRRLRLDNMNFTVYLRNRLSND